MQNDVIGNCNILISSEVFHITYWCIANKRILFAYIIAPGHVYVFLYWENATQQILYRRLDEWHFYWKMGKPYISYYVNHLKSVCISCCNHDFRVYLEYLLSCFTIFSFDQMIKVKELQWFKAIPWRPSIHKFSRIYYGLDVVDIIWKAKSKLLLN